MVSFSQPASGTRATRQYRTICTPVDSPQLDRYPPVDALENYGRVPSIDDHAPLSVAHGDENETTARIGSNAVRHVDAFDENVRNNAAREPTIRPVAGIAAHR
ncbi:hypothetical protein FYA99_05105 [Bordetella parapertussis]|uniref:Uncharacterized protein n=2 Tax=Bordetella parapertussis TaxID=519 RepID=K0MI39_BORPB|nr:hypothetical protein BTL54_15930 [Bordetella parapertussis]CCJ50437.1 conserved hypothetical protein [Bordetella parapertussis Bpp5]AWP65375.1 hypothetical protein B7P06_15945 [Bordetella parapertussis]AWP72880.1 hypothetical protein B7O99_15935 [Bordetella parapertussis]AWP90152.1 hypothetical protein B7P05_15935 [Bordetella parapertussis]